MASVSVVDSELGRHQQHTGVGSSQARGGTQSRRSDMSQKNEKLKKKRGETPDNQHQSEGGDDDSSRKNVISGDDVRALAIREEDLRRIREENSAALSQQRSPSPSQKVRYVVRTKVRPTPEPPKPTKEVKVAKPAPMDAPLQEVDRTDLRNTSGNAGLRFDANGNVIPYSILGTLEEYMTEAERQGQPPVFPVSEEVLNQSRPPTVGFERPKSSARTCPIGDETHALRNWKNHMMERKRQQGYISELINKPVEHLLMHQAEDFRKTQEERYLIDRTIHTKDYGKGYRIGSEFWAQRHLIGEEKTGIHMTLNQTQRGYPPPIEHVGVPKTVRAEKGMLFSRPVTPIHHPWNASHFYQQRRRQYGDVIRELNPHTPDIDNVEVIGKGASGTRAYSRGNTSEFTTGSLGPDGSNCFDQPSVADDSPLAQHPDVVNEPIVGPALCVDSTRLKWEGSEDGRQGQIAHEARVSFENKAGQRTMQTLTVRNEGTTAIYYNWRQQPRHNPFDLVNQRIQRFYFDTSNGVILPGDSFTASFVFKSEKPGIFTEQWRFATRPVLAAGAALLVTLRGVAVIDDEFKQARNDLEKLLAHKQAERICCSIVSELVDGIRTPERPRSPIDAYITEEELFRRRNPKLQWHGDTIGELRELHRQLHIPREEWLLTHAPKAETPADKGKGKARGRPTVAPSEGHAAAAAATGSSIDHGLPSSESDRAFLTEPSEKQDEENMEKAEGEEAPPIPDWDLYVDSLQQMILELPDDDPRQEEFMHRLNQAVAVLSYTPFSSRREQMYQVGYQLLVESIDAVVGESVLIRQVLHLSDRTEEELIIAPDIDPIAEKSMVFKHISQPASNQNKVKPSETKLIRVQTNEATYNE